MLLALNNWAQVFLSNNSLFFYYYTGNSLYSKTVHYKTILVNLDLDMRQFKGGHQKFCIQNKNVKII